MAINIFAELHDAVFVVGALDETIILRGMRYHPIDIENSVMRCHRKIAEWYVYVFCLSFSQHSHISPVSSLLATFPDHLGLFFPIPIILSVVIGRNARHYVLRILSTLVTPLSVHLNTTLVSATPVLCSIHSEPLVKLFSLNGICVIITRIAWILSSFHPFCFTSLKASPSLRAQRVLPLLSCHRSFRIVSSARSLPLNLSFIALPKNNINRSL